MGIVKAVEIAQVPLADTMLLGNRDGEGQDLVGRGRLAQFDLTLRQPFDNEGRGRRVRTVELVGRDMAMIASQAANGEVKGASALSNSAS